MAIDFDDLLKGYNWKCRNKDSPCESVKAMMIDIYKKHGAIERASEVIGIAPQTFWRKLVELNIPRLSKGWQGEPECLRMIRALGETRDLSALTIREIAKKIKYSASHVRNTVHDYNISCLDGRSGKARVGRYKYDCCVVA